MLDGWVEIKFDPDIHGPLRRNCNSYNINCLSSAIFYSKFKLVQSLEVYDQISAKLMAFPSISAVVISK